MKDIKCYNIVEGRYKIDVKGMVYDKLRGDRRVRPFGKGIDVLLLCKDGLSRLFNPIDLLNKTYTEEEQEELENPKVYCYDKETNELLEEYDRLDDFLTAYGYAKSQYNKMDEICKGVRPQTKTGKIAHLIITYKKL